MKTLFLDLEATGTDPENDRIIEIGIVNYDPEEVLDISLLVNPLTDLSREIINLTGISNDELKRKPEFHFYAKDLLDLLQNRIIIGYNILRFDIPLLISEFERLGLSWDTSKCKFIDLYKVFVKKEPRDLAGALKFYADIQRNGGTSHRAQDDASDCIDILLGQIHKYQDELGIDPLLTLSSISIEGMIDFAGKFIYSNEGKPVFNFGKHKGKEVYTEVGMLEWMLGKDFPTDTKEWARNFIKNHRENQIDYFAKDNVANDLPF